VGRRQNLYLPHLGCDVGSVIVVQEVQRGGEFETTFVFRRQTGVGKSRYVQKFGVHEGPVTGGTKVVHPVVCLALVDTITDQGGFPLQRRPRCLHHGQDENLMPDGDSTHAGKEDLRRGRRR
jgi:hypothetical protein